MSKIVVGKVLTCEDVPETHLHICQVDVGEEEPLQIVCGAPNVKAGIKVITALVGARIARLPISSRNPMLDKIIGDKPRLIALNKADLADRNAVKSWVEFFEKQGIIALAINSKEAPAPLTATLS
ncbi:hypothetical protein N568_0112395 [Lactococcus garvieae TRF1]|uniref:tRNA-binding domain-containing protein n=1 Tax=Lactococcus garvieae TRF1 TaxID=1380772 RepID=V8AM73_9LACT|nr:hypothetical protein N568_0112395 [Lactococcus garvieae TRF1]